jgi:hypothetical protein
MSNILIQTTITEDPDDWDISRFSLLVNVLRVAGHKVTARNHAVHGEDDPILSRLPELDYDQLWLMAVDAGDGLTDTEAEAVVRFRADGGGVLTARDHQDLGSCLLGLGSLGAVNHFHANYPDPRAMRDDQDTPSKGEVGVDGRPMGRALAASTFHHFADYNWDCARGAPSFVSEPPGGEIMADPCRLAVYQDYIRNIATWLHPSNRADNAAEMAASTMKA